MKKHAMKAAHAFMARFFRWELKKMRLTTRNLALSGLFIALSFIMPFFTMQIPAIGSMLCPIIFPFTMRFLCGVPLAYRRICYTTFTLCHGGYAAVLSVALAMHSSLRHTDFWQVFFYKSFEKSLIYLC
jgi:hypothetical protein